MSPGYRYKRGVYDGQRIVNIYCGNCLLVSYNNLKIAITKNEKEIEESATQLSLFT